MANHQNQPHSKTFNINSKHFSDSIDSMIVRLIQTIAIEYQVIPDPEAKAIARGILQNKVNQLLTNNEKNNLFKMFTKITESIKNGSAKDMEKLMYEALKTAGYDNVGLGKT